MSTCYNQENILTILSDNDNILFAVLPLVVSIDSPPDSPLTANKSNSVSCTSYGSSPPAVISWWLDGIRLDHQDTQVGMYSVIQLLLALYWAM